MVGKSRAQVRTGPRPPFQGRTSSFASRPCPAGVAQDRTAMLLGCPASVTSGEGGEPAADLVCLGDLQRLTELKGLLPDLACLPVAASPMQRITKTPQRLGLAPAVAELPVDGESQL